MKKIICLIESLGSGGAERQLTGLATLLTNQGHDVEVWYYAPNHFYCVELDKHGVKYRFIGEALNKFKRIGILRKALLKAKPDTVISYLDAPCIIGCITKVTGGKFKLIVSERNTTQHITLRDKVKFFLYRFADHVVPNSFSQAKFIEKNFPFLANKVTCITNFVDTDRFQPATQYSANTPTRVLTVARIMPQKNVVKYIEAIKEVVDRGYNIHIDWYGNSASDGYYNTCMKSISEKGLCGVFNFHAATNNIIDEYHTSDIFCLPSIYEGFPNVVCEAMSCGLPILCSNVCDNPDIVTSENGYLFTPTEVTDISAAIIRAISMTREQREVMSKACRNRAINLFSKEKFIDSYSKLL